MEQLLGVGRRHGATIQGGADAALTAALTRGRRLARVFQISVLGPVEVRRDGRLVPVPGGKTSELLVRLALEAGRFVRADRLVDDLWAGAADPPQHAAVEDRQAAPGARGSAGDRQRRRRLQARRRARRGRRARVLRDAATASRLLDAGDDRGAAELSASALERYRGEVLPAPAGDWAAPHRARLDEARMKLVETQFSARLRLGDAAT